MKLKCVSPSMITAIEFSDRGVLVYRNEPELVNYNDINALKVTVEAYETTYRGTTHAHISKIEFHFDLKNNVVLEINTKGNLNTLYKLSWYKKEFADFEMRVNGTDKFTIPLKFYNTFGVKLPISNQEIITNINILVTALLGMNGYFLYTEMQSQTGLRASSTDLLLTFSLPFLVFPFLLSAVLVYQEYLKFKVRTSFPVNLALIPQESRITNAVINNKNSDIFDKELINFISKIRWYGILLFIISSLWLAFSLMLFFESNHDKKMAEIVSAPSSRELQINPLTNLDGFTQAKVYDLRKKYIDNSIFRRRDYEPQPAVFAAIADNKYWRGTENLICYDSSKPAILTSYGDSIFSKLINNPAQLIDVDFPNAWNIKGFNKKNYPICDNKKMLFIPESLTFSKKLNLITVKYKVDKMVVQNQSPYQLIGLNARDLGFNWGYVYNTKNVFFGYSANSIKDNLYVFQDYFAVGYSCGIEGGCNNLCPMQTGLQFHFAKNYSWNTAVIDLKLWQKQPLTVVQRPDIYFKIIFEMEE